YEQRRREITQARRFAADAAPLLRQPAQHGAELSALLERVKGHLKAQPPVEPYCKAVVHVQGRIEAARRGETPPVAEPEEHVPDRPRAASGQRAPDFVATDLIREQSVRLYQLLGRPVLLVFFNPAFETARDVLRFAAAQQRRGVTVLGMSVSDD